MKIEIDLQDDGKRISTEIQAYATGKPPTMEESLLATTVCKGASTIISLVMGDKMDEKIIDLVNLVQKVVYARTEELPEIDDEVMNEMMSGFVPVVAGDSKFALTIMEEIDKPEVRGKMNFELFVKIVFMLPLLKKYGNKNAMLKTLSVMLDYVVHKIADEFTETPAPDASQPPANADETDLPSNIMTQIDDLHLDDLFKNKGE